MFFAASWALSTRATADAHQPPLRTALAQASGPGSAPVTLVGRLVEDAAVAERGVALRLQVARAEWAGGTASVEGAYA